MLSPLKRLTSPTKINARTIEEPPEEFDFFAHQGYDAPKPLPPPSRTLVVPVPHYTQNQNSYLVKLDGQERPPSGHGSTKFLVNNFQASSIQEAAEQSHKIEHEIVLSGAAVLKLVGTDDPLEVCSLFLDGQNIWHISDELEDFSNLTLVDLGDNHVPFEEAAHLQAVVELHLYCNGLSEIRCPAAGFLSLETLNLAFNSLRGSCFDELAMLPRLRYLDLTCNGMLTLPSDLSGLASLELLVLERNKLTGECLIGLSTLPALRELNLNDNLVKRVPDEISEEGAFESLEVLSLAQNRITSQEAILPLTFLSNLREVDLWGNAIVEKTTHAHTRGDRTRRDGSSSHRARSEPKTRLGRAYLQLGHKLGEEPNNWFSRIAEDEVNLTVRRRPTTSAAPPPAGRRGAPPSSRGRTPLRPHTTGGLSFTLPEPFRKATTAPAPARQSQSGWNTKLPLERADFEDDGRENGLLPSISHSGPNPLRRKARTASASYSSAPDFSAISGSEAARELDVTGPTPTSTAFAPPPGVSVPAPGEKGAGSSLQGHLNSLRFALSHPTLYHSTTSTKRSAQPTLSTASRKLATLRKEGPAASAPKGQEVTTVIASIDRILDSMKCRLNSVETDLGGALRKEQYATSLMHMLNNVHVGKHTPAE